MKNLPIFLTAGFALAVSACTPAKNTPVVPAIAPLHPAIKAAPGKAVHAVGDVIQTGTNGARTGLGNALKNASEFVTPKPAAPKTGLQKDGSHILAKPTVTGP